MRPRKDEDLFFFELIRKNKHQGWILFIERYSSTILQTVRRCAFDYDETMEIYVYTAEKLSENNCARLKQFRGVGRNGQANFTTWLVTLVINFCRAWVRQKKGRKRLFEAIKALGKLDQKIFDLYFWQGYSEQDIVQLLDTEAPEKITPIHVHQSLQRINRVLTQKNKWKIVTRLLRSTPMLSMEQILDEQGDVIELNREFEKKGNPETELEFKNFEMSLVEAMAQLSRAEQRLLTLRFQKGLTIREIALLMDVQNYKILYRRIENVVEKIRHHLKSTGHESGDFDFRDADLQIFE